MIKKIFMFTLLIGAMVCNYSCKPGAMTYTKYIKINQEAPANNFSSVSLQKFISSPDNQGVSVVVRNPYFKSGDATGNRYEQVCSMVERGLMEQKYNPRDRQLFENAVAKLPEGSDYVAIRKATGTDLIFEVSQFNVDEYVVDSYTTDDPQDNGKTKPFGEFREQGEGKKKSNVWVPYSYVMYGFSIEIKVILLADNLISGTFKYYYTPCTDGAAVTYFDSQSLRYSDNKQNHVASETSRKESNTERFDRQISDFISGTVIPSMFKEMRGEKLPDIPSTQQSITVNTTPVAKQQSENNMEETKTKPTPPKPFIPFSRQKNEKKTEETRQNSVETTNQTSNNPQKNSYDLVKAVSDLISHSMEEQQSKLKQNKIKEYKTDWERFSNLTSAKQQDVVSFILSVTSFVNTPLVGNDEIAIFCKSADVEKDQCTIAFLDGKCVGVGSLKKGLFTSLPKDEYNKDIQTLSLYSCSSSLSNLFNSPINFSLKNYYPFEYNKMKYVMSN